MSKKNVKNGSLHSLWDYQEQIVAGLKGNDIEEPLYLSEDAFQFLSKSEDKELALYDVTVAFYNNIITNLLEPLELQGLQMYSIKVDGKAKMFGVQMIEIDPKMEINIGTIEVYLIGLFEESMTGYNGRMSKQAKMIEKMLLKQYEEQNGALGDHTAITVNEDGIKIV